jgi:hypothetical protein
MNITALRDKFAAIKEEQGKELAGPVQADLGHRDSGVCYMEHTLDRS